MSETVVLSIVTGTLSLLGTVFTGWMAYLMAQLNQRAKEAAIEVKQVKRVLSAATATTDAKLDGIAEVSAKTHTLVNSNMAVQLRLNAVIARRLANLTGEESDARAADLAEQLDREHSAKQATVDTAAAAAAAAVPRFPERGNKP